MDKYEELINIYHRYGITGIIVIAIAFLGYLSFFKFGKKTKDKIVDRILMGAGREAVSLESFKRKLIHIKQYDVRKANIRCIKKREMFYDFVDSRINKMIDFIEKIKDQNFKKMTNQEILYMFTEGLLQEREISNNELSANGMPHAVLEKITVIEKDENKILSSVIKNTFSPSNNYITNYEKVAVVIDFASVLSEMIIVNAERILDRLNGELDNVSYKGHSCESCSTINCEKNAKKRRSKNV